MCKMNGDFFSYIARKCYYLGGFHVIFLVFFDYLD